MSRFCPICDSMYHFIPDDLGYRNAFTHRHVNKGRIKMILMDLMVGSTNRALEPICFAPVVCWCCQLLFLLGPLWTGTSLSPSFYPHSLF